MTPRWEWRTFGDDLTADGSPFTGLPSEGIQESDELYLLSLESDECIKVRDDLMDVKHFEEVNADGLERWQPVLKAPFPLAASDLASVLGSLRADHLPLARDAYTVDQLLDEVVAPSPELRAVAVHKHREHYLLNGCMAELTDVSTDSGATRTIVIESEDAALAAATLREAGFGSVANVSFPRGLKKLTGFGSRRYAVIDVGTNSVKFHIGELAADGTWSTVVDRSEVTRLGEGLDETGKLNPGPLARTAAAIARMSDEAAERGVVGLAAVGTAGLRLAPNSAELLREVEERCGVTIEIISGEEEGRLAYLAVTSSLGVLAKGSLVVFDTGGGSSQFTFTHDGRIDERFSVPVGAVRFTEHFELDGVVSDDVLTSALDAIAAELSSLDGRDAPDTVAALGGAITNLTAVKLGLATYDPDRVNGTVLERSEVERQIELYRARTAEERRQIVGLQPGRAEVILAGACIVRMVMTKLACSALTVSDRGLRHGLLVERFGAVAS